MKRKLLVIIFFMISLTPLWANGGGIYLTSSAFRSGNPVCREIKDITLLSEKLVIDVLPDGYCDVTVKYVLWNTSDKDYLDIDYGFPIDYISTDNKENLLSIKDVFFSCNGKTLDFDKSESVTIPKTILTQLEPIGSETFHSEISQKNDLVRRWYYTRFSVEKYSLVNLEVRYSYRTLQWSDGSSPYWMDYYPETVIAGQFLYDFSPASSWGDGIIRDFYVEINLGDLPVPTDHYQYGLSHYKGLDFQYKDVNKLEYRTRNFDLKKAQPLFISYCVQGITALDMLQQFLVSPKEYSVKCSQQQKAYPITNIYDMNLATTWVGKVGDWIEFSFENDNVIGFCIVNGYQKSSQTYVQNNRVKTIRIDPKTKGLSEEVLTLEDRFNEPVYFENVLDNCYWHQFDLPEEPIKTIRFTIDDVYPGTKYDDTCISEILFFKHRKEPL